MNNDDDREQVCREMPRYKCRKEVHALKIARITTDADQGPDDESMGPGALLWPAEEGYAPFYVDPEYIERHRPRVGGYYVVYEDGYKSFSPGAAFEDGYTRL